MPTLDRDRYDSTRRHLDILGYHYVFPPDSLLLVEALTKDLVEQVERIRVCEKCIEDIEQDKEDLVGIIEPHKRDVSRLSQENEELNSKLEELDERYERKVQGLKAEVRKLQDEIFDLTSINEISQSKLEEFKSTLETLVSPGEKSASNTCEMQEANNKENHRKYLGTADLNSTKVNGLMKQMETLRQDNCKLSDMVISLKKQIKLKDTEMQNVFDGNGPRTQTRSECCCRCKQKDNLIQNLEQQVQETVDKQHEAMARAVQLAERNQLLEKDLKEFGQLASTIEQKRDSRQKEFDAVQERLNTAHKEIEQLEKQLKEAREKWQAESKISESLRGEKRSLQHDLSNAVTEKKALSDKVNQYVIAEKELKEELERLREANKTLHRRWMEKDTFRECKDEACRTSTCPCKCPIPPRRRQASPPWKSKRLRDKTEPKICGCAPSLVLLDKLQQERDYYHEECHMLREQVCHSHGCNQVSDKGKTSSINAEESLKLLLDRVERERDVALADLRRVQDERDYLKERFQREQFVDQTRFDRLSTDALSNHGVNRSSVAALERQCEEYRLQLRTCQAELAQVNTLHAQLKTLHDQTDRSFTGTQSRLMQLEAELAHTQSKTRELEKVRWELEEKLSALNRERATMIQNLNTLEKEKDELSGILDDKTERLVRIEAELQRRDTQIADIRDQLAQAQKKFELTISEKTTKDHAHRTLELTLERLREDLEQANKVSDTLKAENRRLQDDLTAALRDGHAAHKEVDLCRQEVANLKRQLQQYVTEVTRAEELITVKEKEQNDMLSNFHTLSLEASSLENSNHNLESEVQISRTLIEDLTRQVQDLENKVAMKDGLVVGCEKQITSLTSRIAELEGRLDTQTQHRKRAEQDLTALRELCSTIDGQKESLRQHASTVDEEKSSLRREVRRLSEECNGLNDTLMRERSELKELRDSLNHSRQETLNHQMSNQELTTLIHKLRRNVEDLNCRLETESKNVRRYQEQCMDLGKEVTDLRREVTNVRYESSRGSDRTRWSCVAESFGSIESAGGLACDVPPLSLPRSCDLSPVSSDNYFSLDESSSTDVCDETYRILSERSVTWSSADEPHRRRRLSDIAENTCSVESSNSSYHQN